MLVELFGVRGSLPTPLSDSDYRERLTEILLKADKTYTNRESVEKFIETLPTHLAHIVGGNTTCVSVTSKAGNVYILDAGTGIRALGDRLVENETFRGKAKINFFITHTHWDHIQGFPFFKPAYIPGNKLTFYSPYRDLEFRFKYQQQFRFFPKKFEEMPPEKEFIQLKIGEEIKFDDGVIVDYVPLKHPGASFAYRFREKDKTFIFATDSEFTGEYVERLSVDHGNFFTNANLLIIDSQYSLDEAFMKFEWGHTSYTMAVNCGIRWNVDDLVLTHHEPSYNDEKICDYYSDALEHRKLMESTKPNIHLAREGLKFEL